jgi:hypothetical protein
VMMSDGTESIRSIGWAPVGARTVLIPAQAGDKTARVSCDVFNRNRACKKRLLIRPLGLSRPLRTNLCEGFRQIGMENIDRFVRYKGWQKTQDLKDLERWRSARCCSSGSR